MAALPVVTNAKIRGLPTGVSQSFRGGNENASSTGTVGEDQTTTNLLPRRHKSFERPLEIRQAHITSASGKS